MDPLDICGRDVIPDYTPFRLKPNKLLSIADFSSSKTKVTL
jgi:hypothetical protein